MNEKIEEKIVSWLEETFSRIGEFCESTLEVEGESLAYARAAWPTEALDQGMKVGAVQQVRGGDPPDAFGFVFDRGFAIFMACRLLMLLPSAIEEKMQAVSGDIDEDDIEGIAEVGNVVTGVINQLSHDAVEGAWQIEFAGLHAPGHPPKNTAFSPDMHAFSVRVHAEKRSFMTTLFIADAVLENWFSELLYEPPAAQTDDAQDDDGGAALNAARAEFSLPMLEHGSRNPWLIVDRVETDALQLASLMRGESIGATTATSMEAAIGLMKERLVEGMFIDMSLEHTDGLSFLKRLRQNFLTDDLPIIITSSSVTRDQVMEAVRAGATHIVVKPVTEASLKSTLQKAINRHPRFRHAAARAAEIAAEKSAESNALLLEQGGDPDAPLDPTLDAPHPDQADAA